MKNMLNRKTLMNLDPLNPEFENSLKQASREAIAKAHAAGISTLHSDGKVLFRRHPGGCKEYKKT